VPWVPDRARMLIFRTGNAYIVSGLKTFLETGSPLVAA
jgi:hypothetical protein